MNREASTWTKIKEGACLVGGLAGMGWQTVVGPVDVTLFVGFLVLTGAPGVWRALEEIRQLRQWPMGGSSSPPALPESPTDSGVSPKSSDGEA